MTTKTTDHRRRSIRLKGYDYSSTGAYFVTVCTQNRAFLFGDIVDEKMCINGVGAIVQAEWLRTAEIRQNILIDEYVIMPNHLHGIIIINDCRTYRNTPPLNHD